MTKADLVEQVSRAVEISRREGAAVVETILGSILQAVRECGQVQIRRFGTFATRQRRGRIGRNPKTGSQVQVPPKRIPYFRLSTGLLELINGPPVSRGSREVAAKSVVLLRASV